MNRRSEVLRKSLDPELRYRSSAKTKWCGRSQSALRDAPLGGDVGELSPPLENWGMHGQFRGVNRGLRIWPGTPGWFEEALGGGKALLDHARQGWGLLFTPLRTFGAEPGGATPIAPARLPPEAITNGTCARCRSG